MACWSEEVMKYQTELRNKNRGYMELIVWQKAMELFELAWNNAEGNGRRSINEYIESLYIALGSVAEAMTGAIALPGTNQMAADGFEQFDVLHYEIENRSRRLVEKLEQKRDAREWTTGIAEEDEDNPDFALLIDHSITSPLHYSTTPSLRAHA
jgi:hypothetical protein